MKPVSFKGQNVVFAKDQPEYQPLPALKMPDGEVITCWELSDQEIEDVTKTKRIYLQQLTFNQPLQPVIIHVNLEDGIDLIEEQPRK
tara:strand:+ start:4485 stop:4745 length:261 start_codon:yes stop_codon:yes gene_type:complete